MRTTARFLSFVLLLAAPVQSLSAQAAGGAENPPRFSVFLGAAATELSGGPSRGGKLLPGPIGAAVEYRARRVLALRAELVAQIAGADLKRRVSDRDERIERGQVGAAALVRRYSSSIASSGYFIAFGGSLTGQTFCEVVQPSFLDTETVACEDADVMAFRPSAFTTSVIAAAGMAHGRFDFELRYDHGLQAAIATRDGDMRARSLAAVLHYRFEHNR